MNDGKATSAFDRTVALAGNPNAGKTTLFNALTGLNQKVANYPGVTVERKTGVWRAGEEKALVIDLPGLYSLDASSIDEAIARDVLTGERPDVPKPDVVIAVVDATNLERNLYLVTQLLEGPLPVVIALTMIDVFEKEQHELDVERLSALLGVSVIPVNSRKGRGITELADAARAAAQAGPRNVNKKEIEEGTNPVFARYSRISEIVQQTVRHNDRAAHRLSGKIDSILTHRFLGLAVLVAILLLMFQAIFSWAAVPMDLLDSGFGALSGAVRDQLPEGILTDLLVDGVIAGVGAILVFLPQIVLLFIFISLLEDTGYMARAAFLLDKLMSRVGLHGKAFLPLISSFACAIPGIMATRTIEDRRDRFATIMIAPFMSCSARLPVYTLMIAAFFSGQTVFGFLSLGAVIMLGMYGLGILVAIAAAFLLKRTLLKAPPPPFIMEMPSYRLPSLRTVFQNVLERAGLFVKRAGTVILAISIVLWALTYFPRTETTDLSAGPAIAEVEAESVQLQNSYAGMLGRTIEPVIQPLGFDWKIGVALIASFAAREVLVSTLSIIYNVGKEADAESETLVAAIRNAKRDDGSPVWTPLTAVTLMVFFVLAMQCMSTVAVVRRETNSWRWTLFMVGYMTALAYFAAFVTYQGGRMLGFG
ncbi:MAG TPA: ferrous iron transport protein B [Pyrinomonadaceae bacterium]|nr:ferrous iron transport protein B [Pyrinomonadaceae bacterium]HMP65611.1 ferrous iron transport protein B [Pyrinomonadaceae bacterium]